MNRNVDEQEHAEIVALLKEHGGNRHKVAKICGRGVSTVQRVAVAAGIESACFAPKKATEAHKSFAERDRLATIDRMLDKGEELLNWVADARDYKDVVMGLAVSIDKHRLETGEVTDRTESRRGFNIEEEFKKLDERLGNGAIDPQHER